MFGKDYLNINNEVIPKEASTDTVNLHDEDNLINNKGKDRGEDKDKGKGKMISSERFDEGQSSSYGDLSTSPDSSKSHNSLRRSKKVYSLADYYNSDAQSSNNQGSSQPSQLRPSEQ
jgi:hypothetical protein